MKKQIKTLIPMFILAFGLTACATDQPKDPNAQKPGETEDRSSVVADKPAISLFNNLSVRTEPKSGSKWLTGLSLGEEVVWTGESAIDSTDKNRQYLKVRLTDGTEGWTVEYGLATEARPAAVSNTVYLFKRPDLVTITDKTFEMLDVVAVTQLENDWLEVVGMDRSKSGWIENKNVSFDKTDVAVAVLYQKAMKAEKEAEKVELINSIINSPALQNSVFARMVEEKIAPPETDISSAVESLIDSLSYD